MDRKFNDQELVRRSKLKDLQNNNKNPYEISSVKRTCSLKEFKNKYEKFSKEELHDIKNPTIETVCGRFMSSRQTFSNIKDFSGTLQLYFNKKEKPEILEDLKIVDIGDIVSVTGIAMKTMTNEITMSIHSIKIISKSLKVLPEKFHGLQDEEIRARQRYIDLIVNEESMKTFVLRSKIVSLMRQYMDNLGYLEVETPVLQPILGGATARPFKTHHNALDREYYLRIATELPLKRLIVGGFEKVYEIGRIFRNEGMDATHNPEFTSMECYTAYEGMEETMDLVENIFKDICRKLEIKKVTYRGFEIDLEKSFEKKHMADFVLEETGIDFRKITKLEEALKIAKDKNIKIEKHQHSIGHILNIFYEEFCEAKCIQPIFVFGHPIEVSPLAKIDYNDKRYTQRFELFIGQKEFANAYAELNDPIDQ